MANSERDMCLQLNRRKGVFGLGRSLCPLPTPMAVCKSKIKKWFQPCSHGLPSVTDYPPMPEVKSLRRDD